VFESEEMTFDELSGSRECCTVLCLGRFAKPL
jgi:hypothetical protein